MRRRAVCELLASGLLANNGPARLASGLLANNEPARPAPDVVFNVALPHKLQTQKELWQCYGMCQVAHTERMQHLFPIHTPSPSRPYCMAWQVVKEVDAKYTVMAKSSKVRADL